MITITKAVQTCFACPSQWDAWDADGNYYYLRFRWGHGTVTDGTKQVAAFAGDDPYGGFIDLDEFCERAGITLEFT